MSRWYGKFVSPYTGDLGGKTLIFIKKGYANFTFEKEYPVIVRFGDFCILDDDKDYFTIGKNDIGRLFEVKH